MTADRETPTPGSQPLSVRTVVEAILQRGPISRAHLAKLTGLSKQTTSEAVRLLEQDGWVRVHGRTRGAVGRSAVTYEIRDDAAFVVGVDLGGSKVRAAVANLACVPMAEELAATDRRGGAHVVAQIGGMVERLGRSAGVDPRRIRVAVVGTPGIVAAGGRIELAPNVPGFDKMNVVGALAARLGVETIVENDVNLAVQGEHWQGHGRTAKNLVFIALGNGIGMGLMLDGRLVGGSRGGAGEIGFLPLGTDPFAAENLKAGALESAVKPSAIVARYEAAGGVPGTDVRTIFELLRTGEPAAAAAIDGTARLLALAVASVQAVVDPEMVVFGGSIGRQPELCARVAALLASCTPRPTPVVASALADRATLVGALATGLSRLHKSLFGLPETPGERDLPQSPSSGDLGVAA